MMSASLKAIVTSSSAVIARDDCIAIFQNLSCPFESISAAPATFSRVRVLSSPARR